MSGLLWTLFFVTTLWTLFYFRTPLSIGSILFAMSTPLRIDSVVQQWRFWFVPNRPHQHKQRYLRYMRRTCQFPPLSLLSQQIEYPRFGLLDFERQTPVRKTNGFPWNNDCISCAARFFCSELSESRILGFYGFFLPWPRDSDIFHPCNP